MILCSIHFFSCQFSFCVMTQNLLCKLFQRRGKWKNSQKWRSQQVTSELRSADSYKNLDEKPPIYGIPVLKLGSEVEKKIWKKVITRKMKTYSTIYYCQERGISVIIKSWAQLEGPFTFKVRKEKCFAHTGMIFINSWPGNESWVCPRKNITQVSSAHDMLSCLNSKNVM